MKIFYCFILLFFPITSIYAQIERDIKSFGAKGNGINNDHAAFQSAADFFNRRGGNGKLIISKGNYLVGNQIKGRGAFLEGQTVMSFKNIQNLTIEFRENAEIKFKDGMMIGSFDPKTGKPYEAGRQFTDGNFMASPGNILEINTGNNIQILNARINGNQNKMTTGGRFGDVGFQLPADGIFLSNCSNVLLKGGYVKNAARDGIQITDYREVTMRTPPKNIVIDGITCDMSGRQGMSITGGNGITVKNSNFNNTYQGKIKSSPGSGVDIEAENSMVRDIKFYNCYFINNGNTAFVADSGPSRDIYFEDCVFHGIGGWSVWTTRPNTKFKNCKIYGSIVHGYDSPNEADATVWTNCHFENLPLNGKPAYNANGQFHLMEINYTRRQKWINCTFVSHFDEKEVQSRPYYLENSWKDQDVSVYPSMINCTFHFGLNLTKQLGKRPDYLIVRYGVIIDHIFHYFYGVTNQQFRENWYFAGDHVKTQNDDSEVVKDIKIFQNKFPYKSPNYGNRYTPPSVN